MARRRGDQAALPAGHRRRHRLLLDRLPRRDGGARQDAGDRRARARPSGVRRALASRRRPQIAGERDARHGHRPPFSSGARVAGERCDRDGRDARRDRDRVGRRQVRQVRLRAKGRGRFAVLTPAHVQPRTARVVLHTRQRRDRRDHGHGRRRPPGSPGPGPRARRLRP